MLLRSVVDHVKAQNWTAVGIDFCIVVVGVFIGIQVANWNDARKARHELDTALGHVAQNISDTIAARTDQIRWSQRVLDGQALLLATLDGRVLTSSEWDKVYSALPGSPPPPSPDRYTALVELQSSGRLKDVTPPDLRKALSELLAWIVVGPRFLERGLQQLTAPDFAPGILKYEFRKSDDASAPSLSVVSIDLDTARSDAAFRLRAQQLLNAYVYKVRLEKEARAIERMVLEMLRAEGYEPSGNWLVDNIEKIGAASEAEEPEADN
jgi:hypothetical protein